MINARGSSGKKKTHKEYNSKESLNKGSCLENNDKICNSSSSNRSASKKKRNKKNSLLDHRNIDVPSKPVFPGKKDQLSQTAVDLVCDVLKSIEAEEDDDDDDYQVCGRNGENSSLQDGFPYCYANNNSVMSSTATKKKSAHDELRNTSQATSTPVEFSLDDRVETTSVGSEKVAAVACVASEIVANTIKEVEDESFNSYNNVIDSVLNQTGEIDNASPSNDTDKNIRNSLMTNTVESEKDDEYLKSSKTHQISQDKLIGISDVDIEVIKGFLYKIEEFEISASEENDLTEARANT